VMPSPITGSAGNLEFLLHARAPEPGPTGTAPGDRGTALPDLADLVDSAVDEAHGEKGTG